MVLPKPAEAAIILLLYSHSLLFTRSGQTTTKDVDKSKANMFHKETMGKTVFESEGIIDLHTLQFLSADSYFHRKAIYESWIKYNADGSSLNEEEKTFFMKLLEINICKNYGDVGYFKFNPRHLQNVCQSEFGLLLSQEAVEILFKDIFKRFLSISIKRTGSYPQTAKLEVYPIFDPIEDVLNPKPENWIEIDSIEKLERLFDIIDEMGVVKLILFMIR